MKPIFFDLHFLKTYQWTLYHQMNRENDHICVFTSLALSPTTLSILYCSQFKYMRIIKGSRSIPLHLFTPSSAVFKFD